MVPSSSSFKILNIIISNLRIFLCIPASATNPAAFTSYGIKTLLANGLSTFSTEDKLVFSDCLRSL